MKNNCNLQSRTKLLEKVLPIMSTFLRNKTISRTTYCGEKSPSRNSMLLPTNAQGSGFLLNTQQHCFQRKGEREEPVQLRCLEKMLSKYTIFSTVLSKIVGRELEGGGRGEGGDDQLKKKTFSIGND